MVVVYCEKASVVVELSSILLYPNPAKMMMVIDRDC